MKRLVIIGANGQIGSELVKAFVSRWWIAALTQPEIEITESSSIKRLFKQYKPDLVINTAAFHQVDECELHPQTAWMVNAVGAKFLAEAAAKHNTPIVHFSTDYVFGANSSRRSPYLEVDPVAPVNVYGISKAAGEFFLKAYTRKYILVRTSGVFGVTGSFAKGSNFVERVVERAKTGAVIRMVNDQFFAPTYAKNLAENLELLVRRQHYGTYHIVSQGSCSWCGLAKKIVALLNLPAKIKAISTRESGALAPRPLYTVLENTALKRLGIDMMRKWQENLKLYLIEKGHLHAFQKTDNLES